MVILVLYPRILLGLSSPGIFYSVLAPTPDRSLPWCPFLKFLIVFYPFNDQNQIAYLIPSFYFIFKTAHRTRTFEGCGQQIEPARGLSICNIILKFGVFLVLAHGVHVRFLLSGLFWCTSYLILNYALLCLCGF